MMQLMKGKFSNEALRQRANFKFTILFISSPVQMYRKRFCITPCVGIRGGSNFVDVSKRFYIKVFSLPGQSPGRAIVLPPASAWVIAKC